MKNILSVIIASLIIAFSFQSCKVLKPAVTTICDISTGVCPILGSVLASNKTVTISPVKSPDRTKMVLISGKGIAPIICTIIGTLCPIIENALANGQSVEITPVDGSENEGVVKASGPKKVHVKIRIL